MPVRFLALLPLIAIIGMEAACASRRPHDAEEIAGVARLLTPTFEQGQDGARLSGEQFVKVVRSLDRNTGLAYLPDGFKTQVLGAVAWTSYRNRITFTPPDRAPTTYEVSETMVLVRGSDGRWRVDRRYATALRKVS